MKKALLMLLILVLYIQEVDAKTALTSNKGGPSIIKRAVGASLAAMVGTPMSTCCVYCFAASYAETPLSWAAFTAGSVPIFVNAYPYLVVDCFKKGWHKPFSDDFLSDY